MGLEGEFWFSLGFGPTVPVSGSHFPSAKCVEVFLSLTNSPNQWFAIPDLLITLRTLSGEEALRHDP